MFPEFIAPRALRAPIDEFVGGIVADYSDLLRALTQPLLDVLVWMDQLLRQSPWWLVVSAVVLLAWLASEENSHLAGQTIYCDGGADTTLRGDDIWQS